jgi:hypothetical protein
MVYPNRYLVTLNFAEMSYRNILLKCLAEHTIAHAHVLPFENQNSFYDPKVI